VVCTRRAAQPTHGEELWSGAPRALAERLEREGARRVYVDGGALVSSFLRERLVQELTINVIPIVLGAGRPLFAKGLPEISLRLAGAKSYPSGLVQLRYEC
jgi:dihydrofolate reductase